ncbi:uncharacterized protein LOC142231060 [Haematobia irritans]|uniref:uncharacterized protein LOC142231060 n=1 Tax=Haematobia irritans TaxID=7368 RepID=UPI003F4F7075
MDILIKEQRDLLQLLIKYEGTLKNKSRDERTHGYLNALAQRIDDLFSRFEGQHDKIVREARETSLDVHDVPYLADDVYFTFSDKFLTIKGQIIDSLPDNSVSQSPMASTFAAPNIRCETSVLSDSRLPKINLPKFSGEYMEWVPFRDIYCSLVHNNDSLNKVQKFYYLKGTLSGEAANLIKAISATEANYESAWRMLEARYHNRRILVGSLISKLFAIPRSDGSFQSIKLLLDSAQECLSSLGNLEVDTDSWDPILLHLLIQKLDLQTRRDWENSLNSNTDLPTRSQFFSFLERTFRTLESLVDEFPSSSKSKSFKNNKGFTPAKKTCHVSKISKQNSPVCIYCEKNHWLSKCYTFLALPLSTKNDFLINKKVCRNCLVTGHEPINCTSPFRCISCKQLHHTILHQDEPIDAGQQSISPSISSPNSGHNTMTRVTSHTTHSLQSVVLYTIRLKVFTFRGTFTLRALLDPGSQGSLISESAVQLLGLKRAKTHSKVIGVGDGCGNLARYSVDVDLYTREDRLVLTCTALVLSNLSSYSPDFFTKHISLPEIAVGNLADPHFYMSDPIDLILGSDVCSQIKIPTESFVHDKMFFQNTHFGWVFSGLSGSISSHRIHIHCASLDGILRSFWEQEEILPKRDLTDEDLSCENYFSNSTKQGENGRYMVNLPFKSILRDNSSPKLHNNIINACRRFRQLELSFSRRPQFADDYKRFMREYESLGHMTKIGQYPGGVRLNSYFLPHHGVLKETSTTTKLRVVFDGSSHQYGYTSLNEELCSGPPLQNDLPSIITRWRRHKIAFSADIEKMFRQIDVCPDHRKFQQILWRYEPFDEISIYELNTVTYGTTSAPYLAIRVLQKLAEDFKIVFPKASQVLVSDSYVDDIISGADNIEDARLLRDNLNELLRRGGCNLRKWISNSNDFLENISKEDRDPSITLGFDHDNVVKTLGLQWNTRTDSFSFNVNLDDISHFTKRLILSESARLYDPLGWLTPSTVIAKSLFKALWENGLDWDTEIPTDIRNTWLKYRNSLKTLENLNIPRWFSWSPNCYIDLHCFCDASNIAYAAVVYCRIVSAGKIFVNILQAKSKVTPIKTISIPRLELCAAKLLVDLTNSVNQSLNGFGIRDIFYWSDSSTVLSWLQKPPSTWTVYVANRVSHIQHYSKPRQWRYVPSSLNPADGASRGVFPDELIRDETWWYGPKFLYESQSSWPRNLPYLGTSEEERTKKLSSHNLTANIYPEVLSRFSSMQTLLRTLSLCFRFIYNCKHPTLKITGSLTLAEINTTLHRIIKIVQVIDYPDEFKLLRIGNTLKGSSLIKLMPFIDNEGLLRVGGRLQNSSFAFDMKHPIILSKRNPLSSLLILDSHEKTLHGGITLTMSYVGRKFWIISGNQLAKTIIHKCMKCFRFSAKTSQQIMGNLPAVRLNASRPFKHSGVDYAGPIMLKNSSLRSTIISKGYICVFVCMVTKALHLEAVSDLTTNAFMAAFRRFVSRRGTCTDIYSDCGTNFVGASKELKILFNRSSKSLPDDLRHALSLNCTNWHFIPPASPNFGGLWEAGVKSVKHHLKRIVNDRLLNFEELSTLLCQIESCLNSRPLCPLSADPTDFEALTPAHFLIGEPTNSVPEESLLDTSSNRLSRWKNIEKMKQHFWKRWHSEYINRLQARPKWLKEEKNAKIGELVLISDERCAPGQWLLGRIVDTHPGPDGKIRHNSISDSNN